MHFDHVALATRDAQPVLETFVGDLGGTVLQGAEAVGFRPIQIRLGDACRGMTVELLEPFAIDRSDFLERFLSSHGPGPHHITMKVDDFPAALDRVSAAGYTPLNVLADAPRWKEAFLSPREAHGTVVQLAHGGLEFATFADQFVSARADGPYGEPRWWADLPERAGTPTVLDRVVVRTPALESALAFYAEILDGVVAAESDHTADVTWAGGACVRLELDRDQPPGIDRLELSGPGPARALDLAGTRFVING